MRFKIYFYFVIDLLILFSILSLVNASSIDSVQWDKVKTKVGENRNIIVSSTGYSDGTPIILEVREDDGLSGSDLIQRLTGSVKNNIVIVSWSGGNDLHRDGLFNNEAEYFVNAMIGSNQKFSSIMSLAENGNLAHGQKDDCDFDSQCQNLLYCEGIPALSVGGGGFAGDGCCFDYENWNVDQNFCNYAIKGQVFKVITNPSGSFNAQEFSNINLAFVVYDISSVVGHLFNIVFTDYIKADSNGNFRYNPEFNRENSWNSNILFNFKIDVYALDSDNKLIAKWTNDYNNDNSKYKRGNDYVDQRVRIHTDIFYWKGVSVGSSFKTRSTLSIQGAKQVSDSDLTEKQQREIDLIKDKIKLGEETKDSKKITVASAEFNNESDSNISEENKQEEILYALWKGTLKVDKTEEYNLSTSIDGNYRLVIDDKVIFDNLLSDVIDDNIVELEEGEHNLTIEYINLMEKSAPNLLWKIRGDHDFSLISSNNLVKSSIDFQYYLYDNTKIVPTSKFKETSEFNSLIQSSNSVGTKSISSLSSPNFYQVSFLEAPRKSLNVNKEPLVLVHGIHGESGYFSGDFEDQLNNKGFDTWKFYYPNDQKVQYSSALLADGISYVKSIYNTNKVKVVAHSMGGLVTRSYLEGISKDTNNISIPYNNDISYFAMLGTPNHGSFLANNVRGGGDLGIICGTLNSVVGWLLTGKNFVDISPGEPAYEDLSVGSEFLWQLNNKSIPSEVKTLDIAGKWGKLNLSNNEFGLPCIPFEADNSDSIVSVASSSLLDKNISLLVMNKNHLTLYQRFGSTKISTFDLIFSIISHSFLTIIRLLLSSLVAHVTDLTDITNTINAFFSDTNYTSFLDSGESYITQNDFSSNPFTEGMALIHFININDVDKNTVLIKNGSLQYKFTQNPDSKIFYHYNTNSSAIDYGLTIPKGAYDLYVNDRDSFNDVEVKSTQTNYFEFYSCNANWSLQENWSTCTTKDLQFKDWIDLHSCNLNITKPSVLNQSCDYCLPNWTKVNTGCLLGDFSIDWYNDTNSCFAKTNLTSDLIGKVENITYSFSCDFDKDGFIGNVSHINTTIKNISRIKKNNTFEFMEGNKTIVSFEFNATNNSIDLTDLMIDKNSENSSFGYLIIKGLDLTLQNKTKTVYVDRILNGTGICVKDEELGAISEVSDFCDSTNETWLACTGISEQYSCNLTDDGLRYIIIGLRHSGIKEQSTFCGDSICNGGESCSSCSSDCGSCPVSNPPSDGVGNSGGGGGGGGGGSSGGGISAIAKKTTPTNTTTLEIPIEQTNQTNEFIPLDNNQTNVITQQGGRSFLTGAVIGVGSFVKSKVGIIVLVFVLIIGVIIGGRVYVRNKNTLKVKFPKSNDKSQGFYYSITTQVCKRCGKNNAKWRRFCVHCGESLVF